MNPLAILGGTRLRQKPFVGHAIIEQEERDRVKEVLDSGMLSGFVAKAGDHFLGGKQVKELEGLVREYFSVPHAVAVNSATAGLHAALGACGVGPGDEVIVPPYTMSASATAIVMQNAVPVFADIDPDTFSLDPEKVAELITPRTKAIVVVHLFGYPADMDALMTIARKHNLKVVEDCAQAPGAKYKGTYVGTIGDVGVFSLNQHKTITCGEGGLAITKDEKLALRMQLIRNHGEVVVRDMPVTEIDNIVGYNYRMTELEAAVSVGQFRRLDALNAHRIRLAGYLTSQLSSFSGLTLPNVAPGNSHVYFVYPIKFDETVVGISRDTLVKALNAEGIPFGPGYVRPIYLEPMYQKRIAHGKAGYPFTAPFYSGHVNYAKGICPVTERLYEKELMMTPVCRYPHTTEDIDDVASAFRKVYENVEALMNSPSPGGRG